MIPYIFCYTIVIFETFFSEKMFKEEKKELGYFFGILIILTLSIFAGMRDLTIGADVLGYVAKDFYNASYHSLKELLDISNEEYGFIILCFICNKLFGNIHALLFIIELIISTFLFLFLKNNRKNNSMIFTMIIYLLFCYPESFCIVRQHIALAICLFATKYINNSNHKKENFIKLLIFNLIAYMFHSSAILFIIIDLLIYISNKDKIRHLNRKIFFVFLIASIILIFNNTWINLLIKLSILPERYLLYFDSNSVKSYISQFGKSNLLRLFYKLIWIIIFLRSAYMNKTKENRVKGLIPCILLVLDLIIYIASCKYIILSRLNIILFESTLLLFNNNLFKNITIKQNKIFMYIFVITLLLFNFYAVIIRKSNDIGGYNVYPYIFEDDYKNNNI